MRHTRREVVARARQEFARLDHLVRRLGPADWERRVPRSPARDPWTVKDALAHIVYWKTHTARVLRGEGRLPEMRGLDVSQINHLIYERWRPRPPAEVVRWHRRVHAEVLETLGSTPLARFGDRDRSPDWPADLDGHSEAHRRRDLEVALGGPLPAVTPRRGPASRPVRRSPGPTPAPGRSGGRGKPRAPGASS